MIQYSGGTLINRLFNPLTRQDWVNNVTQALSDAGWTTISGTPGSGSDVKLETAAQNAGAKIRFRFLEPGSGNCAQVTMKNVTESVTSAIAYCNPLAGAGTWRIVANKFQFFAFAVGNSNTTVLRASVFGGTLWTPTFLGLTSSDSAGWMEFGGISDATADAQRTSWRVTMRLQASGLNPPAYHVIYQGNSFGAGVGAGGIGDLSIPVWQCGYISTDNSYRWSNGALPIIEPFLAWGTTGVAAEARLKGQLYDAALLSGQWSGEGTVSFDGHTWLILTNGPTVNMNATAVLILAVT